MLMLVSGAMACLGYVIAAVLQAQTILNGTGYSKTIKALGGIAVMCHGITTWQVFVTDDGFNLGVYPMLSLMALSIVAMVLVSSLRRRVDNLFIVLFPVAMVTVAMELIITEGHSPRTDITGGIVAHILLSIAAYSLLTIAAAQALLLSIGDNMLRGRHFSLLRGMPPLQTMEQLMFELLWSGLIFLTLSIATGFIYLKDFSDPGLMHHTVITMLAWLVFAILMWGRYQLGWRGTQASRWTLSGFVLLALGYFGSKIVLELILGRV
ncbi:MAG: ABC-type uncharacterized transport system permease subunit [Candidatus Azotimanducaceae bacterium]|jgi:ABC-type uncharacterized transport system permease subunit